MSKEVSDLLGRLQGLMANLETETDHEQELKLLDSIRALCGDIMDRVGSDPAKKGAPKHDEPSPKPEHGGPETDPKHKK
jgi:hypothetical protein